MLENLIWPWFGFVRSFLQVSTLQDARNCPKLLSCATSRKTNDANLRKWEKTLFWAQFCTLKIFYVSFSSTSSLTFLQANILWNLQKILGNKLEKMAKNLISALTLARFLWVLSLLDIRHSHKLSLYSISRKT